MWKEPILRLQTDRVEAATDWGQYDPVAVCGIWTGCCCVRNASGEEMIGRVNRMNHGGVHFRNVIHCDVPI